jgi:hypothetical protein
MDLDAYNAYVKSLKGKRDKLMCMPLDKIRDKTADEILDLVGLSEEVPVRLEPILKYFGISSSPFDFTELENSSELKDIVAKRGNILGLIISKDDRAGIFYRGSDSVNRQRFTIAHELGHCALADGLIEKFVEFRHDEVSSDEKEVLVNTFAGELLIPEKALLKLYEAMPVPYISLLAKVFAVSVNVMKERMKVLGLSYA